MNEICPDVSKDGLKAKAVKGAGINVATNFLGTVLHMAGVVILARLVSPKDFGLVAMVTAFSQWFMNFGVNGFTEYIIQKQDLNENTVNSIFWIHLITAVLLASGFTVFGLLLVDFYSEPTLCGIASAMSLSFVFCALFTSHAALLRRQMKFTALAITELVAVFLSIVFAIASALGGLEYWSVVIRQLMVPFVTMIGVWMISPWKPGVPRQLSDALPGLKYAFQVYFNFSLTYVTRSLDKVLLGKFHGSAMLGNYDRAYQLSSMPAVQLLTPLHSVALSTLSRLKNDRERFSTYFCKAISMIAFFGTIATLIVLLSARDLIYLLLGPAWNEAGLVVMAFSPGIAATLIYGTHPWLHLSLGTPDRWLRWNVLAVALMITAFAIAAPYGAVTMAVAYSVSAYVLIFPGLWYAGRPIQLSLKKVMNSIWAYFTAAIVVCACWQYLSIYWTPLKVLLVGISPLSRIIMNSFVGLLLYLILVIILQRNFNSILETVSVLRLMLSRKES